MQKQNYQKWLEQTIQSLEKKDGKKPTLLLHACCAPCSSYCLEYLAKHFDITVLYYNPNISPKDEYERRLNEITKFIALAHKTDGVKLMEIGYDPQEFVAISRGHETDPEGGERCKQCYRLRLQKAAEIASKLGFDYFTTTLSISPYKNSEVLNQIGREVALTFGLNYLFSDFKKNNGYHRSIELSKEYDLYRQDYCGCIFSKMEYEKRKLLKLQTEKDAS